MINTLKSTKVDFPSASHLCVVTATVFVKPAFTARPLTSHVGIKLDANEERALSITKNGAPLWSEIH